MSTEINEKLDEILARYEASIVKTPDSADTFELLDKISLVAGLRNDVPALVKALRKAVNELAGHSKMFDGVGELVLAEIATILNAAPSTGGNKR